MIGVLLLVFNCRHVALIRNASSGGEITFSLGCKTSSELLWAYKRMKEQDAK